MRFKLLKRIILLDFVLVLLLSQVLGVAEPESSEHRVKERRSLDSETFTLQDMLETIASQINETRFMYFDSILTNTIGPRPYNSSHNMEASKFIAEELNVTQSIFATYQWFTYEGKEIANVIGTLPSANVNNQSKIVVCAHFDTVSDSPGADDNGSGVSLLLEVARVLSQFKFNCTIEFVAFNAEEEGLVGSSYYVQQASQVGEDILLAINVDMVIWDNPDAPPHEKLWIVYQGTVPYEDSERFADLTYETGHAYTTPPIQKISNTNDTYGPIGNWNRSDHASFWQEGIPALWIFEFNGFQNPYIHKPDDSMDAANYNFTLGTQAAQVVAVTIAKLASPLTDEILVPDDYPTIQEAINNASDGDTIRVRAGTYYENVVVNKTVSLIGENKHNTIIDGNNTIPSVVEVVANNTSVTGFTLRNSALYSGLVLVNSSGNTISHNIMTNNYHGIGLWKSNNNILTDNKASNNEVGIGLYYSNSNILTGNNGSSNNWVGIFLLDSSHNTLTGNNAQNNDKGIILISSNNVIFHNNFINNTDQVYINSINTWDNGFEGNYWSDYTGEDLNNDGIGDNPYVIDEYNQDNYPLMGMFSSFNTSLGIHVNVISNSTIEDFQYFKSNSTIKIHVSNMTATQTYGFCRIRIPHALMNETYHVTIDGAEPYYVNYTLYDDGDNRWIYFSYEHSTLEIVIIPEFPSALILPLLMILSLVAVVLRKTFWK